MISDTYKFLYIDIVKTAGTSIGKLLEPLGGVGKHHSISRKLPALGINAGQESPVPHDVVENYFKFTIVRNPYDRLISLFSHCQTALFQQRFKEGGWNKVLGTPPLASLPETAIDRDT